MGGLLGNMRKKNEAKMINNAMRNAETKRVWCPRCGKGYTVRFLGPNDTKTCTCGYKIHNS
ncbi:MAG: hypothetical protein LIP12_15210 [Clostridiales bacterium]|nr:hypothetical protein [Clostridiales bacterium]